MTTIASAPPAIETFQAMPVTDLVARYGIGVERFDRRVLQLTDAQLDTAFLPSAEVGRWPCRVLLGHLADAELAFVYRMRRVVAEDGPVMEAWDESAFIDRGVMYGTPTSGPLYPVAAYVATIHTLRRWIWGWLGTLPEADFDRRGMHAVRGEQTLKTILSYDTWHLEHHAWYLNRKIERFLGPVCKDEAAASAGGCGPGCGCRPKSQG